MNTAKIEFTVNGKAVSIEEESGEMLSELLRYRLGLTGTKVGCNESECGACTVLINGEPTLSCNFPAVKAHGKQILTVEGLAAEHPSSSGLHPLQDAFVKHGAVQCGFCIPGMLMSAIALLDREPDPSEADVRAALRGNLCRCTGYVKPIEAVQLAAARLREVTDG